jgi:hypothetical protein
MIDKVRLRLQEYGIDTIMPNYLFEEYPNTYLPMAFSVIDPCCHLEQELVIVLKVLREIVKDTIDFFYLIPTFQEKRFIDGGYRFHYSFLDRLENRLENRENIEWEFFVPSSIPEKVLGLLPEIFFQESKRLQLKQNFYSLIKSIEFIAEKFKYIQKLKTSPTQFETELYNQYELKINSFLKEYKQAIKSFIDDLERIDFSDNTNSYNIVIGFMKNIEAIELQELMVIATYGLKEIEIMFENMFSICNNL